MMLPHEIAELLEAFAVDVEHLPGVSRTNPHIFGEQKSELVHKMRCRAKELRTVPRSPVLPVGIIRPGVRTIDRREVSVETRRRA